MGILYGFLQNCVKQSKNFVATFAMIYNNSLVSFKTILTLKTVNALLTLLIAIIRIIFNLIRKSSIL